MLMFVTIHLPHLKRICLMARELGSYLTFVSNSMRQMNKTRFDCKVYLVAELCLYIS